jgi:hypothetical protein
MASAVRANVMRVAARQLRRQTPATALRAVSLRQQTAQMQLRSMGVFSSIKNTVTGKMEERNQHKQRG